MIQDPEDGLSSTPMAISSKQNTNELRVKESKVSNTSSLDAKTEALYAFRTITTMLSLIQSTREPESNRPKSGLIEHQKKLLRLLDAFAAVLVRHHGVIAVTARPYDGSGKVDVLASYLGNGESLTISQPWFAGTGQLMNKIRNVFISQNPRDSTVKHQEVVDPETSVPVEFKAISNPSELLEIFLIRIW
jgi:hypothetical protein